MLFFLFGGPTNAERKGHQVELEVDGAADGVNGEPRSSVKEPGQARTLPPGLCSRIAPPVVCQRRRLEVQAARRCCMAVVQHAGPAEHPLTSGLNLHTAADPAAATDQQQCAGER
jgi:hypothetical protein